MRRRRPMHIEPVRCICQPGKSAHEEHAKPGKKAAAHLDPRCPHSTLTDTTKPLPKPKKRRNLRLT
jgi:hypothetical protein